MNIWEITRFTWPSSFPRSAEICREIMASGELGIVEKTGIADLQTRADRAVQDCILGSLRANFPGLAAIGEEGDKVTGDAPVIKDQDAEAAKLSVPAEYAKATLEDICVWVDPLDGTKEYTEGLLDHVTVLIGIAVGKKAVAGVINQPYFNYQAKDKDNLGRTIYGVVGGGVRGISRTLPPADKRIVTTTRSHGTGLVNDCAEACKPTDIIRVGGAGHKVMLLIEGKAHAYVFPSPGKYEGKVHSPDRNEQIKTIGFFFFAFRLQALGHLRPRGHPARAGREADGHQGRLLRLQQGRETAHQRVGNPGHLRGEVPR